MNLELNELNEFGIECCDILSSQLSVIFEFSQE